MNAIRADNEVGASGTPDDCGCGPQGCPVCSDPVRAMLEPLRTITPHRKVRNRPGAARILRAVSGECLQASMRHVFAEVGHWPKQLQRSSNGIKPGVAPALHSAASISSVPYASRSVPHHRPGQVLGLRREAVSTAWRDGGASIRADPYDTRLCRSAYLSPQGRQEGDTGGCARRASGLIPKTRQVFPWGGLTTMPWIARRNRTLRCSSSEMMPKR